MKRKNLRIITGTEKEFEAECEYNQEQIDMRDKVMNEIEQIIAKVELDNDITMCPECNWDDFCHESDCKLINRDLLSQLTEYVVLKIDKVETQTKHKD